MSKLLTSKPLRYLVHRSYRYLVKQDGRAEEHMKDSFYNCNYSPNWRPEWGSVSFLKVLWIRASIECVEAHMEQSHPPSTSIVVPVTKSFSMTNIIPFATSSGFPARLIALLAVPATIFAVRASLASPNIGVSIRPGETTLILRPVCASSGATARTRFSTAPPTHERATCSTR